MATTETNRGRVVVKALHKGFKARAFSAHIPEGKFLVIHYLDVDQLKAESEVYVEEHLNVVKPSASEYKAATKAVSDYIRSLNDYI